MKPFLIVLLFYYIISKDEYENLLDENATEEYCNSIIDNLINLIKEGYIYNDYHKNPKQPEDWPDYFTKVNLVEELGNIEKKDRKFFDFYRDIETILEKTNDVHFSIYGIKTPNNFKFSDYYYCIPFKYEIKENQTPQIILKYIDSCNEGYDEEKINKIKSLDNKVINQINGVDPFKYIGEIGKKGFVFHSPQARYVLMMKFIHQLPINIFPFKKEELHLSINIEGEEELLEIDYQFKQKNELKEGYFEEFFFNRNFGYLEGGLASSYREESNSKIKSETKKEKFLEKTENFWDFMNADESIKCKVDEDNELNIIYMTSYMPFDIDDFDNIMDKCFDAFYSNDFKLVIIDKQNLGGYAELCVPFSQYVFPKVSKPNVSAKKSTNLICDNFFKEDKIVNPETCRTYTEKDDISKGESDKYSDDLIHNKTKYLDFINIFQKQIMEKKRRKYLGTNKTKKPTEIIIFTDGFAFSCSSIFIRKMQIHGSAIIVGYNIRPDLVNKALDASQSSSDVSLFDFSENANNLRKLGFNLMMTIKEQFDPNDKDEVKIPMEFKKYPVDEVSDIYLPYDDSIYDRFVNKSKEIFEKYNNLENGTCNSENKYLYFETKECDEQLKDRIPNAHGGYVCGDDQKWNQSNCTPAYCDIGYILNDEKNECIKDPCNDINLKDYSIIEEKEYNIEPNTTYIFSIDNKNKNFSFYSEKDYLFFTYNIEHVLVPEKNGTIFEYGNKVYVNFYLNNTENIKLKVKEENKKNENDQDENKNNESDHEEKEGFPIWAIILIAVISGVLLITLIIILFRCRRKSDKTIQDSIEEGPISMEPIIK